MFLFDSLQLVYKLKSLNYVKKYYAFVLTDGLFEQEEKKILQDYISFCEESCSEIFGIGLGYYLFQFRSIPPPHRPSNGHPLSIRGVSV